MSEFEDLPEFYRGDSGHRTDQPTYEALSQLHMPMYSAETGQTGPTLVEAGEHFTTDRPPCQQWLPLNRAAGERYERWLASLPSNGKNLTQEEITEAAYAMRPRDGEPTLSNEAWWPAVIKYAVTMKERRMGGSGVVPRAAQVHRPGAPAMPVMPFAAMGSATPLDVGRAPEGAAAHQPQSPGGAAERQRKMRVTPPMPGTQPSDTPQQSAG
jgi:hypothetical protein